MSLDSNTKKESVLIEELGFDPLDVHPIAKKNLVIFFLVDNSESMDGKKIGVLNTTMEELIPELRGIGGATTDVKLAVMTFSDEVEWITKEPMLVEDFQYWKILEPAGLTSLGEAFTELSKKLSRSEFLDSPSISFAPVIFLLTDGYATDDVYTGLKTLKGNNWYKYGLKVALGIGKNFDRELLERFTGDKELVVTAKTSEQLAAYIKTIAVTSTMIGSKSMDLIVSEDGGELTEEEVLGRKQDELKEAIVKMKETDEYVTNFEYEDGF